MLESTAGFMSYFESIRRRTLMFITAIPSDRLDWAPAVGEFSCGDLIRHLAAAETMFVGAVCDGRWHYPHHAAAGTLADEVARLTAGHHQAMATLAAVPDTVLTEHRPSLDGPSVRGWRLLMALVEHEIHHRSQLAMYLALAGITPPQIYGIGVEDVIARATG